MPWIQLKIDAEEAHAELISNLLMLAGASSVTFEDAADQPLFEPPIGTTPLWQQTRILGLFDASCDLEPVIQLLHDTLGESEPFRYQIESLPDKQWEREWMDHFHPMRFGQHLWICPSWHEPPDPAAVIVMLDPGIAFGTGTHATTRLCLEWLDANPPQNQTIIDYGCGSGILAIAALKLGARSALAIDIDPQALEATRTNGLYNQFDETTLKIASPEHSSEIVPADVLIANILAKPLIELAPQFARYVKPGGKLVLSGILDSQADDIIRAYQSWFTLALDTTQDEWVRLEGKRA